MTANASDSFQEWGLNSSKKKKDQSSYLSDWNQSDVISICQVNLECCPHLQKDIFSSINKQQTVESLTIFWGEARKNNPSCLCNPLKNQWEIWIIKPQAAVYTSMSIWKQGLRGFAACLKVRIDKRSGATSVSVSARHQIILSALCGLSAPAGSSSNNKHKPCCCCCCCCYQYIHSTQQPINTLLFPPPADRSSKMQCGGCTGCSGPSAFDAPQNPN